VRRRSYRRLARLSATCCHEIDWYTHVWRKDDRRRGLVQVCDMERLSLGSNVDGLQRVEAHLATRWSLRLLARDTHLLKLLCHALRTWLLTRWLVVVLRWLVSSLLRCSILRLLTILWLSLVLHIGVGVLSLLRLLLLRHPVRWLLCCGLLTRKSIASNGWWGLATDLLTT